MDRLAHFHFIIIFSSHRWSSASFCFVSFRFVSFRSFVRSFPWHTVSLHVAVVVPSSVSVRGLSFSPGINTHGGTGRAGGATPEPSMSFEWNSRPRPGKKLQNAKYYCPAPPSFPTPRPTVDNTELPGRGSLSFANFTRSSTLCLPEVLHFYPFSTIAVS